MNMLTTVKLAALAGTLATTVMAAPASAHEPCNDGRFGRIEDRGFEDRALGDRQWQVERERARQAEWQGRVERERLQRERLERERIAWHMHHGYFGNGGAPTYYYR
jgi:hypothetical protein